MLRILSILLVIGGLVVAGLGGAALLETYAPKEQAAMAAAPAEEMVATESAAMDDAGYEATATEAMNDAAPAAEEAPKSEAIAGARMAAPESADPEVSVQSEMASEAEPDLNFQVQTEEGPAAMMPPEQKIAAAPGEVSTSVAVPEPKKSFEETLQTVPVAHETPRTAEYKRAFNVTFAIDATGDTTAADALPGRGVIEEGEAKVSDRVEVRLSGAGFNIVQTSPGTQSLSPLTENTWRWSVTPLSAGEHDLTFEIFAIDSDTVTPLRTYRDTVTVKVSGLNRAIAFADQANPLFVLLGGLGSAIAGLFGAIRFFGKR
jgi:hypothetical protein